MRGARDFINEPIASKSSNLDINWRGDFSCTFVVCSHVVKLVLSFGSRKFFTPLFGILRSFGVFILEKFCGSFKKFNTYFLRSLDSRLFFR